MNTGDPFEICLLYVQEDKLLLEGLEPYFEPLQRFRYVSTINTYCLRATHELQAAEVAAGVAACARSDIVFLLASPASLTLCTYHDSLIQQILQRQREGAAALVPILVHPVVLQGTIFELLRVLPKKQEAVANRRAWRNRPLAYTDIAIGIRQVIEEMIASRNPPPPTIHTRPWNVPYARNIYFTDRETMLAHLYEVLQPHRASPERPQAIIGIPGVGKTELAIEYAYRHEDEYSAILWMNASSQTTLARDTLALACLLHLPECSASDHPLIFQEVKRWLRTHDNWLLILDNVSDHRLPSLVLPEAHRGHILLTAQSLIPIPLARSIPLVMMDQGAGALLLLRRARIIPLTGSPDDAPTRLRRAAESMAHDLSGLPLGLNLVGTYIDQTGYDFHEYMNSYLQIRNKRQKKNTQQVSRSTLNPIEIIAALSLSHITSLNPTAAHLLSLCALLSPDALLEELCTALYRPANSSQPAHADHQQLAAEALDLLQHYALLQHNANNHACSIHRLLQNSLIAQTSPPERSQLAQSVSQVIAALVPDGLDQQSPNTSDYLLQMLACIEALTQLNIVGAEHIHLYCAASQYFFNHARYTEARPLIEQALALLLATHGEIHLDVARFLQLQAGIYSAHEHFEEAITSYQQAIAINCRLLGTNAPELVSNLSGLANAYCAQNNYQEGIAALEQALVIIDSNEQASGSHMLARAGVLAQLGKIYGSLQQLEEAKQHTWQALTIYEEAQGEHRLAMIACLEHLAECHVQQNDYKLADGMLQRALTLHETIRGASDPAIAASLHILATMCLQTGHIKEAENFFLQLVSVRINALGPDHFLVVSSLDNLSRFYRAIHHDAPLESLYQRQIEILERIAGPDSSPLAMILVDYAALLRRQERVAEAMRLEAKARTIRDNEQEQRGAFSEWLADQTDA